MYYFLKFSKTTVKSNIIIHFYTYLDNNLLDLYNFHVFDKLEILKKLENGILGD